MNKFKTIILVLISFILQTTVFSKIDIFGANINLILAMIICLSQILGPATAANSGLVYGLLEDLMFSNIIGVRALSYYLIGNFVGSDRLRVSSDRVTGMILTFVFTFVNFFIISLINFIFKSEINLIKNYLFIPLITEAILNTIMYFIYYKIIKKIMYIPTYRI